MFSITQPAPTRATTHPAAPSPATETTGVHNTIEFGSTAGHSPEKDGYVWWREAVEKQRAGYAVAGINGAVTTCGTVPVVGDQVALSVAGKGLRVSGMWRCGSRWCAECRGKVAKHKAAEVEHAVRWAFDNGLIVVMYTLTGSHVTTDELDAAEGSLHEAVQSVTSKTVRKRMSRAWALATKGRKNKRLAEGRVGTITAQEVTVDDLMQPGSRTGIHWHRHHMVILESQAGKSAHEVAAEYGDLLFEYWQGGAEAVGLVADRKGFDVMVAEDEAHAVDLAGYVSKGEKAPAPAESFAAEVSRGEGKNGRGRFRVSPEQVLRNLGYLAEVEPEGRRVKRLFAQWRDLEAGTKGVHWLRWSPGLRDLVGLDAEELTDEEIANTDEIEAEEVAVVSWDQIREHVEELRRVLREVDEDKGWETLLMCLDSLGVDYHLEAVDVWRSRVVSRMAALRVGDR